MSIEPFKKISKEVLWENPWWKHVKASFQLPDGSTKEYEYPASGPAVAIVVQNEEGKFLVQKQYRPFVDQIMYQAVAGYVDEGESVEETAKRELVEEAGYKAQSWQQLGSFYPSAGSMDKIGHVFLAQDLEEVPAVGGDEYVLEHAWKTAEEIDGLIQNGELQDAWAIVSWSMAKLHLSL